MRYFLGFLISIGLIIVVVLLIFSGGDSSKTPKVTQKALISYANTDASVQYMVDGPINAAQDHQQMQIIVDRNNVTFNFLKGYNGEVVTTRTYENTEAAFKAFLQSLEYAGFTHGTDSKDTEAGHCASGSRYVLSMEQGGRTIERYWTTTCGKPATFTGAFSNVQDLFEAQVPDFNELSGEFND